MKCGMKPANDESQGIRDEVNATCVKELFQHSPRWTAEKHEIPLPSKQVPGRDSNRALIRCVALMPSLSALFDDDDDVSSYQVMISGSG